MPMQLRDGSFYLPHDDHYMLLRGGKSVDKYMASFNQTTEAGEPKRRHSQAKFPTAWMDAIRNLVLVLTIVILVSVKASPIQVLKVGLLRLLSMVVDFTRGFVLSSNKATVIVFISMTLLGSELCSRMLVVAQELFQDLKETVRRKRTGKSAHNVMDVVKVFAVVLSAGIVWSIIPPSNALLQHPHNVGLKYGHELYLKPEMFAWHITPPSATKEELSTHDAPVIMHVSGDADIRHHVNTFRSITSKGYHVIAPVQVKASKDILEAWCMVYQKSGTYSQRIMWVHAMQFDEMEGVAQEACNQGIPVDGMIIESQIHGLSSYRSIEIWTGNCLDKKFNYLKCPISAYSASDKLQDQVSSCLGALKSDGNFRARFAKMFL